MIYRHLFRKGSMKIQLRLDKGIMKALAIHHQWNSGSMHDYWLLMQDCRTKTMHDDKI